MRKVKRSRLGNSLTKTTIPVLLGLLFVTVEATSQIGEIGSADWVQLQGMMHQQEYISDMNTLLLQIKIQEAVDEVRREALQAIEDGEEPEGVEDE